MDQRATDIAQVAFGAGDVPMSSRFDDPYFSFHDGAAESAFVFLDGNDLPGRFHDGFQIAELGFGTGLNLLVAWQAWRQAGAPGRLTFTSFEAFPMGAADRARALAGFPALAPLAARLTRAVPARGGRLDLDDGVTLHLILGDARRTLPRWAGQADAWFLDGFSPAKNPELWGADLMRAVADHTRPDGTAATYSAAGHVRAGLRDAGFAVTRVPGYGRKRHMTVARYAGGTHAPGQGGTDA